MNENTAGNRYLLSDFRSEREPMKYRKLGRSDLEASVVGLGTAQFGSKSWGYTTRYGSREIIGIIQKAIDLGINLFDTAEAYCNGSSEELLGQALSAFDKDDFVVVSKVAPWNLTYKGVLKAIEGSLRRLNTDVIDLYLVHYPNPFCRMKETFRAMEELVKCGKIRYIGVSNFSKCLLRKAQENLKSTEIVANEIEYNIFSRRPERGLISYCSEQDMSLIAYSPLAGGVLTDRYFPNAPTLERARAFNFYARMNFVSRARDLLGVLKKIADERMASIAQVALSWIVRDSSFVAIPAALTIKEVEENSEASKLELSYEETNAIDKATVGLGFGTYFFDRYIIRPTGWAKETTKHLI